MNTIDDLRETLAGHAQLEDHGLTTRTAAVAGRVQAVRRRRAAVGAAAVAAAVVGGFALTTLPSPPTDAEETLVGAAVPQTMTSLGYTYELVDGVESEDGEHALRVEVPASDEPRLVSWATEDDDQQVGVRTQWGDDDFTSSRGDFDDFVVIPADESGWVRVEAGSRVALATYELSDERPAGYTEEGVTFRQQAGDMELVGAVVGDRGDTSVSLTVTLPEGQLFVPDLCQASDSDNLGNGPWMNETVNGAPNISSSCGSVDQGFVDGTSGGGWWPTGKGLPTDNGRLGAGDQVTFTRTLTTDHRSTEPIDDPEALLGIAVYALPDGTQQAAGNLVRSTVEHDGHTWRLASVERTSVPADGWSVPVPASDERLLVGLAQRLHGRGSVTVSVDGEDWGSVRGSATGSGIDGLLPDGAQRVGVRSRGSATGEAAVLFYELAD